LSEWLHQAQKRELEVAVAEAKLKARKALLEKVARPLLRRVLINQNTIVTEKKGGRGTSACQAATTCGTHEVGTHNTTHHAHNHHITTKQQQQQQHAVTSSTTIITASMTTTRFSMMTTTIMGRHRVLSVKSCGPE
jgi:hypothetical protein